MARYTLNLQIDSQSLSMMYAAGQRITLARSLANAPPNVTWIVFNPMQMNTVTWDDTYGLYASTTNIANGATIQQMSIVPPPARDAAIYPFQPSLIFGNPTPGGPPPGSYAIQNAVPPSSWPMLTFGLTQDATVNGVSTSPRPVSATPMMSQMVSTLTPTETITLWLQSSFGSSTVVTNILGPTTRVNYGGSVTSATLRYDPNRGVFVPASALTAANTEANPVEISEPSLF